jgi:hypothetical protein
LDSTPYGGNSAGSVASNAGSNFDGSKSPFVPSLDILEKGQL